MSAPLVRVLETAATLQARRLSTRFQTPLALALDGVEAGSTSGVAAALAPCDRVVLRRDAEGGIAGLVWLPRPLFFAWLALELGARADAPLPAAPERDYTRIEERFLLRAAGELWRHFASGAEADTEACLVAADALAALPDEPLWWARLSLAGLGPSLALYVALRRDPQDRTGEVAAPAAAAGRTWQLGFEVARGRMTVARLEALQVGDRVALEAAQGLRLRLHGLEALSARTVRADGRLWAELASSEEEAMEGDHARQEKGAVDATAADQTARPGAVAEERAAPDELTQEQAPAAGALAPAFPAREVRVEIGRAALTVQHLAALGAGARVALDREPDAPADLLVGDRCVARGVLEHDGGGLALRVLQVRVAPHGAPESHDAA